MARLLGPVVEDGCPKFQPCSPPHTPARKELEGSWPIVQAAAHGQIMRRGQHKGSFVKVLAQGVK